MKRQTRSRSGTAATLVLAAILATGGCAARPSEPPATPVRTVPWTFQEKAGRVVRTEHYAIYTTIRDEELLDSLAVTAEAALATYRQLVPVVKVSERPMECYVFARRGEWAAFTAARTGQDAAVYLQINRGGYTVQDWFVSYNLGDIGTRAVVAHEGWHQFVARHFKCRLPPFLEEGIATTFENMTYDAERRQARFNLTGNAFRAQKLRHAMENGHLWPLEKLITMHAGDVVGMPGERIEAFYAQSWAFALFLYEGEGGRLRPAMQRLLGDAASGANFFAPVARRPVSGWDPRRVRPMLESYLGADLPEIERRYMAYVHEIVDKHGGD